MVSSSSSGVHAGKPGIGALARSPFQDYRAPTSTWSPSPPTSGAAFLAPVPTMPLLPVFEDPVTPDPVTRGWRRSTLRLSADAATSVRPAARSQARQKPPRHRVTVSSPPSPAPAFLYPEPSAADHLSLITCAIRRLALLPSCGCPCIRENRCSPRTRLWLSVGPPSAYRIPGTPVPPPPAPVPPPVPHASAP